MRILLVEPFGHREGHFSIDPNYLSQALTEVGIDVTLISFDGFLGNWIAGNDRVKHLSFISQAGSLSSMWRSLSNFLQSAFPLRPFAFILEAALTLRLAFRLNRYHEYDLIHLLDTTTQSLLFLTFASMPKNFNLICTRHGPAKKEGLKDWQNKFKLAVRHRDYLLAFYLLSLKFSESRFMNAVSKILYQRATKRNHLAFICVSQETKQTYKDSVFYEKIVVIPWARPRPPSLSHEDARQHLKLPQGEKLLLSFGINHTMKNYEVIFKAAQNLSGDFKLVFAGKILPESTGQNDPQRFAEEYGLGEKTIIIDEHISDEEMPYYFYAADAIILSYRNAPIDPAGSFLYAYECGLPAIAVSTGHMGELVENHGLGLTFTPEDPLSLRQAILTFLNLSDAEREMMRKQVLRFSTSASLWEKMRDDYLNLYQGLLEK